MSSVQSLREFISERLTAAAEEIFTEFEKTIVRYEEEIDRQRRLMDISWRPEITSVRTELPGHSVWKEEEVLTNQQLCNLERSSRLDQEETEPSNGKDEMDKSGSLQMKEEPEEVEHPEMTEEQEELFISQDVLKQEVDTFIMTPAFEEGDQKEPELNCYPLHFPNSSKAENQNLEGSSQTRDHRDVVKGPKRKRHEKTQTGLISCKICGKGFTYSCYLVKHMRSHTGEKPFRCMICGMSFSAPSTLYRHMKTHTGQKPFLCQICGKSFCERHNLTAHIKTHTGEKPFSCQICGKSFFQRNNLTVHLRTHTGEKPFPCEVCGKGFTRSTHLTNHMRTHV